MALLPCEVWPGKNQKENAWFWHEGEDEGQRQGQGRRRCLEHGDERCVGSGQCGKIGSRRPEIKVKENMVQLGKILATHTHFNSQ